MFLKNVPEFFTFKDASSYLSTVLKRKVSVSEIYYFVITKKVKVSVLLSGPVYAFKGELIDVKDLRTPFYKYMDDVFYINENKCIIFDNTIHSIDGLLEPSMLGKERLAFEKKFQKENDEIKINNSYKDEVILHSDNNFWKLQIELPKESVTPEQKKINKFYLSYFENFPKKTMEYYFYNREELVRDFHSRAIPELESVFKSLQIGVQDRDKYHNSVSLDNHYYQFVIRKNELESFVKSIRILNESDSKCEQERDGLGAKKIKSYLIVIDALLNELKIDPKARGISKIIQRKIELNNGSLSINTIKTILLQLDDLKRF